MVIPSWNGIFKWMVGLLCELTPTQGLNLSLELGAVDG